MVVTFFPLRSSEQSILGTAKTFEEALDIMKNHALLFSTTFKPTDITLEYKTSYGRYVLEVEHGEKIPYAKSKKRTFKK